MSKNLDEKIVRYVRNMLKYKKKILRSFAKYFLKLLEFVNGKLWNRNFGKYLSVNDCIVRADNNDSRGASDWILGVYFINILRTHFSYKIFDKAGT